MCTRWISFLGGENSHRRAKLQQRRQSIFVLLSSQWSAAPTGLLGGAPANCKTAQESQEPDVGRIFLAQNSELFYGNLLIWLPTPFGVLDLGN